MDRRYKKRLDRYWSKMRNCAVKSFSDLDTEGWFDWWHYHIDWEGKGDKRAENREASLSLGYEVLQMAEEFKSNVSGPIQCWWFIHEQSQDDAVYMHSPNENGSPFPFDFKGVTWGEHDNEVLSSLVDISLFKTGKMVNEYGTTYVVSSNQ